MGRPRRRRGPTGRTSALALLVLLPGLAGSGWATAGSGTGTGRLPPDAPRIAGGAPTPDDQRSLVLESLHADIQVESDGSILVTERLEPRFTGSWNGILRHISLAHTTARGEKERLRVEILSAADGEGRPLRHEVNRVDDWTSEARVWVPDARDRTATVVLRYRVRGALRFFAADSAAGSPAYDELYWQVTGTEWEVPIRTAGARVLLPAGAEPVQAAAYMGVASSRARIPVSAVPQAGEGAGSSRVVEVPAAGPLEPGEGLTLAVAWTPGAVPTPPGARAVPRPLGTPEAERAGPVRPLGPLPLLPLALPLLAFWLGYRAWDRRGRDPRKRAVAVRWEPPADLSPAEAGTLLDHDPAMHDILSTLVDLAVRGYVVIVERERRGLLDFSSDYAFHLIRPRSEWSELAPHERRFLDGLFEGASRGESLRALAGGGGILGRIAGAVAGDPASADAPEGATDSVLLSDLRNEFYKELPAIKTAILEELVEKGHYDRRPDQVRARWTGVALGAMGIGLLGVPVVLGAGWMGPLFGGMLLAGGLSSAVILGVFAFLMPARTERGARTREAVLGFRQFLERVETPRYRRMVQAPDQFERFLPYAVAFRCEEKWARAFDDLVTEPPDWYRGSHGVFRPTHFTSDLASMARAAGSTLSSSPSSSGSGGGGSVGGGSGGGGGGGF